MTQPRFGRFSYFEGVMIEVFVAAQVDRLAFLPAFLHPQKLFEEVQRFVGLGGEEFHVGQLGHLEEWLSFRPCGGRILGF